MTHGPSLNTSASNPDAPVNRPWPFFHGPPHRPQSCGQSLRREEGKEGEVKREEPRGGEQRQQGWDKPGSRAAGQPGGVWGEISQSRMGRGSRRVEGVQVSRTAEGSQHAGIAEIVSGEASFVSQLFLNSHELVVLSQTLRTARGTSLDLACAQPHHQVCDEGVLRLS